MNVLAAVALICWASPASAGLTYSKVRCAGRGPVSGEKISGNAAAEVREATLNTLRELSDIWREGYFTVYGNLKPRVLIDFIEDNCIPFNDVSEKLFRSGSLTTRRDAFNSPGAGIYVSEKISAARNASAEATKEILGVLGLHEVLGMVYGKDSDYRLSVLSFLLLKISKNPALDEATKERLRAEVSEEMAFWSQPAHVMPENVFDEANSVLVAASGGGTLVGGGGDIEALSLKLDVVCFLFEQSLYWKAPDLRFALIAASWNFERYTASNYWAGKSPDDSGKIYFFPGRVVLFPAGLFSPTLADPAALAGFNEIISEIAREALSPGEIKLNL